MSNAKSETALMELLAPDGYYSYLGIKKQIAATDSREPAPIDEDLVKKNYRRLSLKHHPDKGGDADTFRVLNRAYRVLKDPKLRQQYDILGIDLDDDEENSQEQHEDDVLDNKETSSSQSIIQEVAGSILTFMIQLGVRTLMMGTASVIFVRYRWTLYPLVAFLVFLIFRIVQQQSRVPGGSLLDTVPPAMIGAGLLLMYSSISNDDEVDSSGKMFWLGETIVIGTFCYNSLSTYLPFQNVIVLAGLALFSGLAALWFRGKFWNYAVVIGLILFFSLLVALAFPMMELLLEAIINEKLKRVGDKVRHHHKMQQNYYEKKAKQ